MVQESFPNTKSQGYDINSKPIFMLTRKNGDGEKESEVIVMDAKMHVITDSPIHNSTTGRNEVSLNIQSWKAVGFSNLLGQDIEMELEPGEQKSDEAIEGLRSFVVAKNADSDFPANLVFNMAYRIAVPGLSYKSDGVLRSTAKGTITQFPPAADDTFEISGKEITAAGIDVDSLLCAC